MSLLEWAAKSRHESANEPVIVAEQFACPGAAAAGVTPPTQPSRATHPTHAVRLVFAQLMATSIGNGCLHFHQRGQEGGPDTGLRRAGAEDLGCRVRNCRYAGLGRGGLDAAVIRCPQPQRL